MGRQEPAGNDAGGRPVGTERLRRGRPSSAFTLIELFVVVAVIAILALMAVPGLLRAQTRAKVAASRNNQRVLAEAIEVYRVDHCSYPQPFATPEDPFGILCRYCLPLLTTPVAYVGCEAFRDPFGCLQMQMPVLGGSLSTFDDPFRPPTPGFNTDQSLFYFYYPRVAAILARRVPAADAFAVASVGPDLKDSFVMYYPFPGSLPQWAALYGIHAHVDTVYDPTNGTISGGDLAAFGGSLSVPRFVGGRD